MKQVTFGEPQNYQSLFESFLQASGVSKEEFKSYLATQHPFCSQWHKTKQPSGADVYDGIYLSESAYLFLDSLVCFKDPVKKSPVSLYLKTNCCRLPTERELQRLAAWAESFEYRLKQAEQEGNVLKKLYSFPNPIDKNNYWTVENWDKLSKDASRFFVALRDEDIEIHPLLPLMAEIYKKVFINYFKY